MQPNQCTSRIIVVTEKCVSSVQLNLLTYLLNELIADAINVKEKGNPFKYSWILISISFVAWAERPDYQEEDIHVPCRGA